MSTRDAPAIPLSSGVPAPKGRVWFAALLVALVLYAATAHRGPQWQDAGFQQVRIVSGRLAHPLGLALVHPVHYYLGRAAIHLPFAEPAFAITLVSSLAGAVAVANLTLTLVVLTGRITPAAIAAAALMLSHTFWHHATHTEIYTIVAALLTGEWLCLACFARTGRGRFLVALALLNGLGIANHLLALLATPADAVVIVWAIRRGRLQLRTGLLAGAMWGLGTLPYSALILQTALSTGDLTGTARSALFGTFTGAVLSTALPARTIGLALGYLAYNFPGLTVPLALYGLWRRRDVPDVFFRVIACQLVLYVLFAIRYPVVDQYAFFGPVYALLALLSGLGLARLLVAWPVRRRRAMVALATLTIVWTPVIYVTTCRLLASRGALASMVKNKPYRDGYRTFFIPWGAGDGHGEMLNEQLRNLAGDDGLILVTDKMMLYGVQYARITGRLPDTVTILLMETNGDPELVDKRRGLLSMYLRLARPVVLAPADRDRPVTCIPGAQWERHGDVYTLAGLGPASPATPLRQRPRGPP